MTSMAPTFPIHNGAARTDIGKTRADPLPRLLHQLTARAGGQVQFLHVASRPWASALFQGRRHLVDMMLVGDDANARADRFAAGLGEAEWALAGHFVADITVDARESNEQGVKLSLSALTIEDW